MPGIKIQWPIDVGKLRALMNARMPASAPSTTAAGPPSSSGKSPLAQLLQYIKALQQAMGVPGQTPTKEIAQTELPAEPIKIGSAARLAACNIVRDGLIKSGKSRKFWKAYVMASIKSGKAHDKSS